MNNLNEDNAPKIENLFYNTQDITEALRGIITAEDAIIVSVFRGKRTGYVTIAYEVMDQNQMVHVNIVTLVVGRDTRMRDQFGNRIGLRHLREDMVINAKFSSAMTRSNPPQAMAYSIIVVKENESSIIEVGRVLRVEEASGFDYLLTGYANDIYSQMRYVISDMTMLRDKNGRRINLREIKPGDMVRIERASFQTLSIPPQTSALTVQIISD